MKNEIDVWVLNWPSLELAKTDLRNFMLYGLWEDFDWNFPIPVTAN